MVALISPALDRLTLMRESSNLSTRSLLFEFEFIFDSDVSWGQWPKGASTGALQRPKPLPERSIHIATALARKKHKSKYMHRGHLQYARGNMSKMVKQGITIVQKEATSLVALKLSADFEDSNPNKMSGLALGRPGFR